MIDVHYASLTSQGVQHRVFYLDGHPSIIYQPRPKGLTSVNRRDWCFPFGRGNNEILFTHTIYVVFQSRRFYDVPRVLFADAKSFQGLAAILD